MDPQRMVVFAEFSVDEIIPLLGGLNERDHKSRREFVTPKGVFKVKINTKRLQCFAHNGIVCVKCGVVGAVFRLEMHQKEREALTPHLNLYAKNSEGLILLTQDHITPKSKGGKDHLSNLQTMCFLCNEAKGSD